MFEGCKTFLLHLSCYPHKSQYLCSLHNPPPGPPAGLNGQNGVNGLNGQNGLNNGQNGLNGQGGQSGQGGQGGQGGQAVSAPRRGRGVLQQQTPGMRVPMCGSCDLQIRSAPASGNMQCFSVVLQSHANINYNLLCF